MKYLFIIGIIFFLSFSLKTNVDPGKPWNNRPQSIPGKIECELYNTGGEGIAYHDSDAVNNGSGKLNPANGTFLNEFRMTEGVDISYTKGGAIDNNPYNTASRDTGKLYVGWTEPGEWINYTVNIKEKGKYKIAFLYTENGDGAISLDIDGQDISGLLKIPTTHNDNDTIPWRQWHHWNKIDRLASVDLPKGIHVLTVHIREHGNMNLDYLEFVNE